MGDMTLLDRILSRIGWLLTGIRHRHWPSGMVDCDRCQRDGWLAIAAQYPADSPEWIEYRKRADGTGTPEATDG